MQIGYGILLDGEIYNFMRKIEFELFEKFGIQKGMHQSPHITIKPPFEVEEPTKYIEYLDGLCRKIKPFKIQLEGFNCFQDKVIYLDVKKNQKLSDAHQLIYHDIKTSIKSDLKPDEMIFHATLAYDDIKKDTFQQAYKFLKKNYQPKFTFISKKIGLFYQLPNDSGWIILKEQSL